MDIFVAMFFGAILATVGFGLLYVFRDRKKKPKRKSGSAWLTTHQLEVLDSVNKHGRRGVLLWHTDINLGSIRSLAKRGFVDTRSGGRIVATRAGKHRLAQSWPTSQPTGDQKHRVEGSGSAELGTAPAASGEASVHDSLTP